MMATFNSCKTPQRNSEWNEGKLLWRLKSEPTFLYSSTDMYQLKVLHNCLHKEQSKWKTEKDLHPGSLYWASKYTPFLSGYTTYRGTHTVAILKGEILKYVMERDPLGGGAFLYFCVFSLISFLLKFPGKCDHLSLSVNTVQSWNYQTLLLLP
jgi:hypothetical protein